MEASIQLSETPAPYLWRVEKAKKRLVGTKPGTSLYKLWEELGAAQKWQVFNHDQLSLIEDECRPSAIMGHGKGH